MDGASYNPAWIILPRIVATFSRRNLPAARAFVDSVVAGGGVGRPRKAPASWSADYVVRIANVWQRQAAAGSPLSIQAARRGPVTFARPGRGEHPRQRTVGSTIATKHRGRDRYTYQVREYRRLRSMRAWIETRIPGWPDTAVQIVAHGIPIMGYDPVADRLNLERGDGGEPFQVWRILYTGPGSNIEWAQIADGVHSPDDRPLFERVTGYEVRWGDSIDESDVSDDYNDR